MGKKCRPCATTKQEKWRKRRYPTGGGKGHDKGKKGNNEGNGGKNNGRDS